MPADAFTSRTAWRRDSNPLARRLAELIAAGAPIIDLTESNPTRCGFAYPAQAIREAISLPEGLSYAPDPRGALSARQAIAARFAARGIKVSPEQLVLTASTSEAYAWLFKLLCEEGDEVLIPAPGYPLFDFIARLEGVKLSRYPLVYDGGWRLDADALASAIGRRTRAVIVVQPNNPTGSFLDGGEIERLRSICATRGMAIISDEVFADYSYEEAGLSLARAGDGEPSVLTFTLGGLSKSAGLPQMKLSWIAITGPVPERDEALQRLEVIGDTFLSVATPVQAGLPRLLAAGESVRDQIRDRVRANRAWLRVAPAVGAAWSCLDADGGWYAVLRVPRVMSDEEWGMTLLEQDRVHLHPGYLFDFPGEGYLVVSLLPEPAVFRDGIRRLDARIGMSVA